MSVGQTPDQETPEEEPVLQKGKGKRELKRQLFSSEIRGDIAEISARRVSGQRAPTEGIACAEVQVWRGPLSLRGSAHYRKGMGNKAGEEGGDETCKGCLLYTSDAADEVCRV